MSQMSAAALSCFCAQMSSAEGLERPSAAVARFARKWVLMYLHGVGCAVVVVMCQCR
jgi:hypothetical protein